MTDVPSAAYVLFGLHGLLPGRDWQLGAAASIGNGLGSDDARWLWLDGSVSRSWHSNHASLAVTGTSFGLRYREPFEYSAYAFELAPALTLHGRSWQLAASPRGTTGRWSSDTLDGDIAMVGGSLQLTHTIGVLGATVAGELYDGRNGVLDGTYRGVGFDATLGIGSVRLGAGVKRWRSPEGSEWGYSAIASREVTSGIELDVRVSRSVTDAVLASPGNLGVSLSVSWRILSSGRSGKPPVVRVDRPRSAGRAVVFTVESAAASMALSGSFSEWTPIPMRRTGDRFMVEVVIPAGTHQFGFLVNGTDWYVPADAPGIVDDGFGRKNATLVIEG